MDICDCIKQLDLSGGITESELERFPCLETCIDNEQIDMYKIKTDRLITILFKAVQELKNEIDVLKAK
jgi:hypothetical protein